MKKLFGLVAVFVFVFVLFSLIGCSENSVSNPISSDNSQLSVDKKPGGESTIVDIAASNPDFEYLVAAVQFAGLVDVLNGGRQLTVFAPTDQAFENLANELGLASVGDLLVPENKELVTNVLFYHVSPGNKNSKNVVSSGRVNTLLKQFIYSKVENGIAKVGNDTNGYANILAVDLRATNGTIHVIDKVLLPE